MSLIKTEKLTFEYFRRDEEGNVEGITKAVDEVSLDVKAGDFIAIIGSNGSGKSTLAKHFNAILHPTEGTVYIDGKDTMEEDNLWDIRSTAGMVFQNPDNQIIGQVVDEDVAFGPENLGVPTEEIWKRVDKALNAVDMYAYKNASPNHLSGGQKQRMSIAGILAMQPKCIILDESTAMLDPKGRREVLDAVHELNKKEGITVILITHYLEETINADYIYAISEGHIELQGIPREVFSNVEKLQEIGLTVPTATLLAYKLSNAGIPLKQGILDGDELVASLIEVLNKK